MFVSYETPFKKENKLKRLQWAHEYKDSTLDGWKKVLWTEIFRWKQKVPFRRIPSDVMSENCIIPTIKHSAAAFMI